MTISLVAWVVLMVSVLILPVSAAAQDTPALRALKALDSATQIGLTLGEYRARVIDAKVAVDRELASEPSPERRRALARAMDFHVAAIDAWSARGDRFGEVAVARYPVVQTCPLAAAFVGTHQKTVVGGAVVLYGDDTLMRAVQVFWACSGAAVREAEGSAPRRPPKERT